MFLTIANNLIIKPEILTLANNLVIILLGICELRNNIVLNERKFDVKDIVIDKMLFCKDL